MKEFQGEIVKILFQKEDFLIAVLKTDTNQIKIIGNVYGVKKGEEVILRGDWETHPRFGEQLKVESWKRPIPQNEEQIIAYLSSPMVKGCGKKTAIKIVEHLGEDTLNIIMKEKETCLSNIQGLGKKRAKKITTSIVNTFELQEIITDLSQYGINSKMVIKMYQKYGTHTLNTIKSNPYELLSLNMISFQENDEIAKNLGIMPL